MEQSQSIWLNDYKKQLGYISTALICSGVLYLLAANWFYFPSIVQLLIPQGLLLIACLAACYFSPKTVLGHCAAITACVMIGLCLASFGQVYQTGADSFQLFAVWSLLLLPWLYFRLSSVYILFFFTTITTFFLANDQILFLSENIFYLSISAILLSFSIIAEYLFQKSRLIILIAVACLCIILSFNGILFYYYEGVWWILAFILPTLLAIFYYRYQWSLGLVISALTLAVTTTIWIMDLLSSIRYFGDYGIFFIIAMIIFIWCWGFTQALRHLLPDNPYLTSIPLAFGAWISSLSMIFFIVGTFIVAILHSNTTIPLIIIGGIFIACGLILLIKIKDSAIFLRHVAYSFLLTGQFLFIYGVTSEADDYGLYLYLPYTMLACQTIILVLTCEFIKNQFWRSLQVFTFIVLFYISFLAYYSTVLLCLLLVIYYFKATWITQNQWRRPWIISICSLILIMSLFNYTFIGKWILQDMGFVRIPPLSDLVIELLSISLVLAALYLKRRYFSLPLLIAFAITATMLCYFGRYYLLALLIVLLLLSYAKDRLMQWLTMLSLALYLWLMYYDFGIPLLDKGIVIISSGVFIALLTLVFPKSPEAV